MRLGGQVFDPCDTPEQWIAALKKARYSTAVFPFDYTRGNAVAREFAAAAEHAGIPIAEVGAWSNPISPDIATRNAAIELCQNQLALADLVGARCCVNISGSRSNSWYGPHPDNLTEDTFDLVVETVRTIIDAVKPARTFYTLEGMPWSFPDSPDSYLRLIAAVERPQFGAHIDMINWISSPQRFFNNAELTRETVKKLGPRIRSCHAKDTRIQDTLTLHLDEVRPGLGCFDYGVFLRAVENLDPDMPVILEHMQTEEEFVLAAGYIRDVAQTIGISIK